MSKSYRDIIFFMTVILFTIISKLIFDKVNKTADLIVDEIFHVPQGLQYCHMNFSTWDPKITTLPGLYLVSTAIMGPWGLCTVYWLRGINLLASIINLYLLYILTDYERKKVELKNSTSWCVLISSINIGCLPPLYFFTHLYYTDTLSLTTILLMMVAARNNKHFCASFTGALSIIVRQTNIIWLGMIFAEYVLDIFMRTMIKKSKKRNLSIHDLTESINRFLKGNFFFNKLSKSVWWSICSYLFVMVAFCVFVILNDGIVVGDKDAHTASLHFPQLFYFSLFCGLFAFPHLCMETLSFIRFIFYRKLLMLFVIVISATIVHFNTIVHPYLLADNRHYTFYVWNRIYAKYALAKYLMIGPYLFAMYAVIKRIELKINFSFLLAFLPCMTVVLVLQKMIDVRYFLVPFIFLRLKFKINNVLILFAESLLYLFINYQTFNLFFTKEIYWTNFDYVQRLMW